MKKNCHNFEDSRQEELALVSRKRLLIHCGSILLVFMIRCMIPCNV
jgi:hypothetical protein